MIKPEVMLMSSIIVMTMTNRSQEQLIKSSKLTGLPPAS